MKSQNVSLLEKIEEFCRKANIAESTFGYLVVNDGKLCSRLRNGKDVTMNTVTDIKKTISSIFWILFLMVNLMIFSSINGKF